MKKHVLITGMPGVGKTTLVKKVAKALAQMNVPLNGFYTEEIRNNNSRIGFDIVTLDNERSALARKGERSDYTVGSYSVFPANLEKLVLPLMENPKQVFVLDEIGKMELLSKSFENSVKKLFTNKEVTILATVPVKGGGPVINKLKNSPECILLSVTPQNRNELVDEVISLLK